MRIAERFFNPEPRTQPTFNGTVQADLQQPPSPVLPLIPDDLWAGERTRVAVSRNSTISGKLSYQGPVRIDGKLRGEVTSTEVIVISESASVEGKVRAPKILLLGSLEGEVAGAETLVLGPASHARGRIQAERLTVCEGARLEGDIAVGDNHPYHA
jgi:cytoskeletal protein CcmA (bactofilin family)